MGTLATRLSATAAAIGLVGGVLATSSAVAAVPSAPAAPAVPASGSIPFSVADPDTAPRPVVTVADEPSTAASGTLIGLPAFAKGPIRFDLEAGTVGFPVPAAASAATVPQQRGLVEAALAPAAVQPTPTPPPATPSPTPSPTPSSSSSPAPSPKPKHVTPKKNYPRLPFHTGKKARSLPDTGVPMSAALGAVTALTALLAGIGTVLAARRRPDHES